MPRCDMLAMKARVYAVAVLLVMFIQQPAARATTDSRSALTFAACPLSTKRFILPLRPFQRGTCSPVEHEPPLRRYVPSDLKHGASNGRRRHGKRSFLHMISGSVAGCGVLFSYASVILTVVPKWAITPVLLIGLLVGASVVHALQGGVRGYLGRSQEETLAVPVEKATVDDVAALSKAGFMQLFYASPCPQEGELDGEYRARTLDMGVLHPIASIITHRLWGPGRWLGKGVRSGSASGYNLFYTTRENPAVSSGQSVVGGFILPPDAMRERRFAFTSSSPSAFDDGTSSKLNYGRGSGNGPLFGGMRDEVRKVNSRLFIGLGYIQAFGGKYNTAPFVLEGPPIGRFMDRR